MATITFSLEENNYKNTFKYHVSLIYEIDIYFMDSLIYLFNDL